MDFRTTKDSQSIPPTISSLLTFTGEPVYKITLKNNVKIYIGIISTLNLSVGDDDHKIAAYLPVYSDLSKILDSEETMFSKFEKNAINITAEDGIVYIPVKSVQSAYQLNIGKILTNMVDYLIDNYSSVIVPLSGFNLPKFSTSEARIASTKINEKETKSFLIGLGQVVCENDNMIDGRLLSDRLAANSGNIEGYVEVPNFAEGYDPEYKFVKIDYTSDTAIKDTINNLATSSKYDAFIINDEYWDTNNVQESNLNDRNVHYTLTKYLDVTVSQNIYQSMIRAKYILSMMDYLLLSTTGNWIGTIEKTKTNTFLPPIILIKQKKKQ